MVGFISVKIILKMASGSGSKVLDGVTPQKKYILLFITKMSLIGFFIIQKRLDIITTALLNMKIYKFCYVY
jgi:hypothetical protein